MRILAAVVEQIEARAREAAPRECCGILLADPADRATARRALPAGNLEPGDPEAGYLLDHRAQLQVLDLEVAGETETVGYYHSHPRGAALPSRRDREQALEGVTYLIIGLGEGRAEVSAWRLEDGGLVREPLEIVQTA